MKANRMWVVSSKSHKLNPYSKKVARKKNKVALSGKKVMRKTGEGYVTLKGGEI